MHILAPERALQQHIPSLAHKLAQEGNYLSQIPLFPQIFPEAASRTVYQCLLFHLFTDTLTSHSSEALGPPSACRNQSKACRSGPPPVMFAVSRQSVR